ILRNPDRTKLSKRKSDTSVDSYRRQGILPEALLNYLATLGWSMPDGREFFSLEEMIAAFDLDRISTGEPVFDLKKLKFFNAKYLREILPLEEVAARAEPLFAERGLDVGDDPDYLLDVVDVLRPRAETLVELADQAGYFFTEEFPYDEGARKQLAAGQAHLQAVERELSMLEFFDYDGVDDMLRSYVQDQAVPMGKVMMPLRAALTGTTTSPGVVDLIVILGKQRSLSRIGRALTYIDAGLPDDDPQKSLEEQRRQEAAKAKGKQVAAAKAKGAS